LADNDGENRIQLRLSREAMRYAAPDAPLEVRRLAARGALPLAPIELATVLFVLLHDGDLAVKDAARKSLETLPGSVLDAVLGGPAHPALLSLLARTLAAEEARCTQIALNRAANDQTVAFLATLPHPTLVDLISHNQERMIRCEEIVESLGANPLTGRASIERILGFLSPCPAPSEALPPLENDAAEAAVLAFLGEDFRGFAEDLLRETEEVSSAPVAGTNLFAAIQSMTVMQKIKLARLGGNDARALLIRDRNKVVASAAIRSPRITDAEVASYAQSKNLCDEVYRIIANNREWTRHYPVKRALATNPKVPLTQVVVFLNHLQDRDLKSIMKSRDVPSAVCTHARRLLQKKGKL